MVSKLNCSSRIERSDTCIDLNEPEVDYMNWSTRSVKRKKVNVLFLVSRLKPKLVLVIGIENCECVWHYLVKARGYN